MYRVARYVVYALLLLLAFRQDASIANNPLQEDGYYSLTVARNLALGNGYTIDGTMHTSGFQPLVTTLSSVCFVASGGDRILGLRFYLLLSILVFALSARVFAVLTTRLLPEDKKHPWQLPVELWYLTSLYTFTLHHNGLETGALLLQYSMMALHLLRMPSTDASMRWLLQFAALLGSMILTRIDVLVPATALLLYLMARPAPWKRIQIILAGACIALMIAPWFVYVYVQFGTMMPSGGAAQTSLVVTSERALQAFMNTAEALMPFAFLRFHLLSTVWGEVLRMVLFVAIAPILWRTTQTISGSITAHQRRMFIALGVGLLLLVLYYLTTSFATWHYTRYFAPVALTISVLGIIAFLTSPLASSVKHLVSAGYATLFAAVLGAMILGKGAGNEMIIDQLVLVAENVPETERVASGQTGTLGFMRENVVNVDGKVNNEALRRNDNIPEYLAEQGVRYFCDEPELVERFLGKTWQADGWRSIGQKGNFVLLRR